MPRWLDLSGEQQDKLREVFGPSGHLLAFLSALKAGKTVADAASSLRLSPTTLRSVVRKAGSAFGVASPAHLYTAHRGRPAEAQAGQQVQLTADGERVLVRLEQAVLAAVDPTFFDPLRLPTEPWYRVGIRSGLFLNNLVAPLLADTEDEASVGRPLRHALGREVTLEDALKTADPSLAAVVTWQEGDRVDQPPKGWLPRVITNRPFEMWLVCRSREERNAVSVSRVQSHQQHHEVSWRALVQALAGEGPTGRLAVVERFPGLNRLVEDLDLDRVKRVDSFGDVLANVLSREATYGLLPNHWPLLDQFRAADLLHVARVKPQDGFPNRYYLAVLTRQESGADGRRFEPFLASLAARLKAEVPTDSPLNLIRPPECLLPTDAAAYRGLFHGYYIETFVTEDGNDEPEWRAEYLHLTAQPVRTGSRGGHTVVFGSGSFLVNDSLSVYRIRGGVLGGHLMYLIADRLPDADPEELARKHELRRLQEFVTQHRDHTGVRPPTAVHASFVACLTYFRQDASGERRRWSGHWLGMNSLFHPLENGMIISTHDIANSDELLVEPRPDMAIRRIWAAPGRRAR